MIVAYDPKTGQIVSSQEISGDEDAYIALLRKHGQDGLRIGIDPTRYYVKDGAILPRPAADYAINTETAKTNDTVKIRGVAAGAKLIITGPHNQQETADGKMLNLSFALPGEYEIRIESFPRMDRTFRVRIEP
jgi:hypothetical protein